MTELVVEDPRPDLPHTDCQRCSLLNPQIPITAELIMIHSISEPFTPPIPQSVSLLQSQRHYSVAPVDVRAFNGGSAPNLLSVGRLSSNRSLFNSSFITVYNTTPPKMPEVPERNDSGWCCCCCFS